jgi:hypothetical protein
VVELDLLLIRRQEKVNVDIGVDAGWEKKYFMCKKI